MRNTSNSAVIGVLFICVAAAIGLVIEGGMTPARANDDADAFLNYSFAVWTGSGIYKVNDADKRFAVQRIPLAYTWRPARYDEPAFRDELRVRLLLPAIVTLKRETETNLR